MKARHKEEFEALEEHIRRTRASMEDCINRLTLKFRIHGIKLDISASEYARLGIELGALRNRLGRLQAEAELQRSVLKLNHRAECERYLTENSAEARAIARINNPNPVEWITEITPGTPIDLDAINQRLIKRGYKPIDPERAQ
ncbi:MAG: hypothetical protein FWK01_21780 [Pantanalinema sp. GBBB05]|nr:hypothetical protein [Pantanalinema sp. GBBB05]